MVANLKLATPRLGLHCKEYSSTGVPWISGINRFVHFVGWEGFEDKFLKVHKEIQDTLKEEDLVDVNTFLIGTRAAGSRTPSRRNLSDVDTRPTFSDCTSIMGVHLNIFLAVEDIVQQLKCTRKLCLKTKDVWLGRPKDEPKGLRPSVKGKKKGTQANDNNQPSPPPKNRTPDFTLMELKHYGDTVGGSDMVI